jgi:hypothetical protein
MGFLLADIVEDYRGFSAEGESTNFRYAQSEQGCCCCIDSVAAIFEDSSANIRSPLLAGDDNPILS